MEHALGLKPVYESGKRIGSLADITKLLKWLIKYQHRYYPETVKPTLVLKVRVHIYDLCLTNPKVTADGRKLGKTSTVLLSISIVGIRNQQSMFNCIPVGYYVGPEETAWEYFTKTLNEAADWKDMEEHDIATHFPVIQPVKRIRAFLVPDLKMARILLKLKPNQCTLCEWVRPVRMDIHKTSTDPSVVSVYDSIVDNYNLPERKSEVIHLPVIILNM